MNPTLDSFRGMICEDDLESAAEKICAIAAAAGGQLRIEAGVWAARVHQLRKSMRLGTLSRDDNAVERARIAEAGLELADLLERKLHPLTSMLVKKRHTILFLAANPTGTDRLMLDREARAIQVALERSSFRDRFELVTRWAATPLDLLSELVKLKPTVVHFSGHSGQNVTGEYMPERESPRGLGPECGLSSGKQGQTLFFHGPDDRPQAVSVAAVEETFGAAGSSVKLVVLNACYSEVQAEALLAHVDCIVGMGGLIHDDAARSFAIGFYGGLGERESVAAAYKHGLAAISLEGLRGHDCPQLKIRDGIDATQLILDVDPR